VIVVVGLGVGVIVVVVTGGAPATSTISTWLGLSRIISRRPLNFWMMPVMRTRLPP
jgi:hypothetical protein